MAEWQKGVLYYGGLFPMIKGVYTACITPFTEEYEIDEEGFRENLQFQIASGVDGLVILGTTAESPTLSEEEQEIVLKIALEEAKGRLPVWVGTGSYSTKEAIKKTIKAKVMGADGALVVTPYYNKPTQEGLFRHFEAIAHSTKFPIIVYNIQGRTGQNLSTDTLKRLSYLPEIVGVKEASGNINQMIEVIETIAPARPEFSVMSGDDALTLPLMSLGGAGVISVASNLIPKEIREMVLFALKGDFHEARKLHYELMPIFRDAFIETNPTPIKFMMGKMGMKAGPVRLPLSPLLPENEQKIVKNLWLSETATLRS
jgi:4-hydroxy-tetrahydrodipicolinate synthase